MNQYSTWKYLLIIILVSFGLLYALPNLYEKSPAVQISATNKELIDQELLGEVEDILTKNDITPVGIELTQDNVIVKLSDVDVQLKAQDLLKDNLDDTFSLAQNLVPNTPDWLAAINADPMVLGLDLQGGVHFLLEVDMDEVKKQQQERFMGDVKRLLRSEKIRYSGVRPNVAGMTVKLKNAEDKSKAYDEIRNEFRELTVIDTSSETEFILDVQLTEQKLTEIAENALKQNITTIRNRVNELGVAEPIVQRQGKNRIIVQLPGVQDTVQAKDILKTTATLEYRLADTENDARTAEETGNIPAGSRLYKNKRGEPVLLKRQVIVTGDQLEDAASGIAQDTGGPMVSVTLNNAGAKRMRDITRDNVGKPMGVVFIERKNEIKEVNGKQVKIPYEKEVVISVATIQSQLGKRFRTTGLDSIEEAGQLALLLRAGALAAPVDIVEERTVGPSLGKENIDQGVFSVLVGFIVVLIFMAIYYRSFGLIANAALLVNLVLIIAVLSMLGATLTLPGIAGIVLTVGMAVDANVLIFERIREEIRNGNTPQSSIKAGYEKALSTIADANITTLIAAIVLFSFGTGPIKGFAVTLSIGIITSMFTAIMGTRALVNLLFGGKAKLAKLAI